MFALFVIDLSHHPMGIYRLNELHNKNDRYHFLSRILSANQLLGV